ncbi:PKD domain-containing protein [Dysgonomonas sp. Marseille-P4677]|nr:PKD domain-containing protein [Dysgonomonas sp. Marseille-P4677]
MNKKLFLYIFCLSLLIIEFSSCRDNDIISSEIVEGDVPVAKFTFEADAMNVKFVDQSAGAESYYWNFGDGTTSTQQSPEHTYATAGNYVVTLKVNSNAGYSDQVSSEPILVAGRLEPSFSYTPELGLSVFFNGTVSKNIVSAEWDFGDGKTGGGLTISHTFPAEGEYTIKMKATGLLGDVEEFSQKIQVNKNMNLLKGSGMDADAEQYWKVLLDGMSLTFGYEGDKPITGTGPCFRFGGIVGNAGSLIYQGVQVEAGKRYKLSAQIKAPAGGKKGFLQFYIAPSANSAADFIEQNGNPNTNHFLALNTWNGWGSNDTSVAVDGDLYEICQWNGQFGLGATNGAIYTAPETRMVYIGIRTLTQVGIGDILVDTVLFELQED